MLHCPTVLFKDDVMAERILQTDSPREQKALGRKVANFEEGKWKSCCRDIVQKGNLAKVWSLHCGIDTHLSFLAGDMVGPITSSLKDKAPV